MANTTTNALRNAIEVLDQRGAYAAADATRMALIAVKDLVRAARLGRNALDANGVHGGALNALDEALANMGEPA